MSRHRDTCRAGTAVGRMCRRRSPQWTVLGDPYGDRFCRQHVTGYARRPGTSGVAVNVTTKQRLDVDSQGALIPATVDAFTDAFNHVRCQEGYDRTRHALFVHLDDLIDDVGTGIRSSILAAEARARHRLSRLAVGATT